MLHFLYIYNITYQGKVLSHAGLLVVQQPLIILCELTVHHIIKQKPTFILSGLKVGFVDSLKETMLFSFQIIDKSLKVSYLIVLFL
jgi:hypothetical protein